MRGFGMAAAGVALVCGSLASAAPLADGGVTAQEVAQVLQSKGFQAEIKTEKSGDPMVLSSSGGATFVILFYECRSRPRCASIQFSAAFPRTGLTAEKVAEWNRTKRFGKAWQDKDLDPWVEMDVDVEHGATTEAIASDLDRWASVLGSFARFCGL
jgi:hypothetical protein